MSMDVTAIAEIVRPQVLDESAARYPDPWMIRMVSLGQLAICRERPDALYDADGMALTVGSVSTMDSTLSIEDAWKEALVEYVLMRCFETEGGNKADSTRAKQHRDNFKALLQA